MEAECSTGYWTCTWLTGRLAASLLSSRAASAGERQIASRRRADLVIEHEVGAGIAHDDVVRLRGELRRSPTRIVR
jgi:hypothetical protein